MNRRLRLHAALLAAVVFAPISTASAGYSCTFYKWSENARQWYRVATVANEKEYKDTHEYPTEWNCDYCYLPAIESKIGETIGETANALQQRLAPVLTPVFGALSAVQVWPGPTPCPDFPPEPAAQPPVP